MLPMATRIPIQSAQKPYASFPLPYVLYMKFDHNSRYILIFENVNRQQTWGELIVNANALLMHYFFQVIQGNDYFTSF